MARARLEATRFLYSLGLARRRRRSRADVTGVLVQGLEKLDLEGGSGGKGGEEEVGLEGDDSRVKIEKVGLGGGGGGSSLGMKGGGGSHVDIEGED